MDERSEPRGCPYHPEHAKRASKKTLKDVTEDASSGQLYEYVQIYKRVKVCNNLK